MNRLILAVMLALSTPALAEPVVIENDLGGSINRYIRKYNEYKASGQRVEIEGRCASACTIYMALPNACIHPDAKFGFHTATAAGLFPSAEGNKWVAQFYPPELRKRFLGQYSKSLGFTWLRGHEVLAMNPKAKRC